MPPVSRRALFAATTGLAAFPATAQAPPWPERPAHAVQSAGV